MACGRPSASAVARRAMRCAWMNARTPGARTSATLIVAPPGARHVEPPLGSAAISGPALPYTSLVAQRARRLGALRGKWRSGTPGVQPRAQTQQLAKRAQDHAQVGA